MKRAIYSIRAILLTKLKVIASKQSIAESFNKYYLIPFNFRAPLIFAQLKRAKNEGARKWPIFAHDGARELKKEKKMWKFEKINTLIP